MLMMQDDMLFWLMLGCMILLNAKWCDKNDNNDKLRWFKPKAW